MKQVKWWVTVEKKPGWVERQEGLTTAEMKAWVMHYSEIFGFENINFGQEG
jgi:hypothetical protein